MTTTTIFRLQSDELDATFIEKVKALFGHREVEIIVREPELDETDYLSSSEANRLQLNQAVADIREGKNLVRVDPNIFQ